MKSIILRKQKRQVDFRLEHGGGQGVGDEDIELRIREEGDDVRDIGGEVVNSLKKKKHKRSLGRDGGGSDNIRKSKDREERGKSLEIDERRRSVGSQHGRESLEREFGRESAERQHSPKSLEMREYESADRDLREWDSVVASCRARRAGAEDGEDHRAGQVSVVVVASVVFVVGEDHQVDWCYVLQCLIGCKYLGQHPDHLRCWVY